MINLFRDVNWLKEKYLDEKISARQLAKMCKTTDTTIRRWLENFNIKIRDHSEANTERYRKDLKSYMEKNWLYKKYIEEKLSVIEIGKLCNVHYSTICNWLKKYKIKKEIPVYQNKKWLKQKYVNERLSTVKIAKICNVTAQVIMKWLDKFNIKLRTFSEARLGIEPWNKGIEWPEMRGKNHPNYFNGKSYDPYPLEFRQSLKKKIRKRDKFECQFCGTKENGKKFPIHHIDYNKENNDFINLITLCRLHNTRANYQRAKWQMFFEIYQELRRI